MNQTIPGILLFAAPTKFTKQSTASPHIHTIAYNAKINDISTDEYHLVGTRSGTAEFDNQRVEEYKSFKQHRKTMDDLVFQNYTIFDRNEYYRSSWKSYYNLLMKKWFGDNLLNTY